MRLIKGLLDRGCDPNGCNGQPLLLAIDAKSAPLVKTLLDADADPNKSMVAATKEQSAVLSALLDNVVNKPAIKVSKSKKAAGP